MRAGALVVDTISLPRLEDGEVLVKTLACGICGSDLHALAHGPKMVNALRRANSPMTMDLSHDVVMGHEFCGEIVEFGKGTNKRLGMGARICSIPFLTRGRQFNHIGYSNDAPGGFGEYIAINEATLIEVPNGLPAAEAAMTEPFGIGAHAVASARMTSADVPLVVGCGPVGLAVIAALKLHGYGPIVAADPLPDRRRLAQIMGADVVVDPFAASPYESWREAAVWADQSIAPPVAPWEAGPAIRPAVVFECVGVSGMIEQIMAGVPAATRIIVVGVCMERDQFEPMFGITKELSLQFVWGYTPAEFEDTLRNIAEGVLDVKPVISGSVGLDGVAPAFERLSGPTSDAKLIVEPWR
ncbi:zinc-binding dehydrogenase [soil metagenome]